jgi:hypothetical protein
MTTYPTSPVELVRLHLEGYTLGEETLCALCAYMNHLCPEEVRLIIRAVRTWVDRCGERVLILSGRSASPTEIRDVLENYTSVLGIPERVEHSEHSERAERVPERVPERVAILCTRGARVENRCQTLAPGAVGTRLAIGSYCEMCHMFSKVSVRCPPSKADGHCRFGCRPEHQALLVDPSVCRTTLPVGSV